MVAVQTIEILKIIISDMEVILIIKILEGLVIKDMNRIQVNQNEYQKAYQILLVHLR